MPETMEAEEVHLVKGLIGRQFLNGHAISGDKNAGAIVAETAVHENLLFGVVAEKRKELNDLLIRGRRPSADWDVHETNAQGFQFFALPVDFLRIFTAQVHDGGDSQFFQLIQALFSGLGAAIEMVVDFAGVGKARDIELLAISGVHDRRRGRLRIGLRSDTSREERQASQGETQKIAFHKESRQVQCSARGKEAKDVEDEAVAEKKHHNR